MAARKLNTDVRRREIAQAALALVAEEGVRGLSIASVAAKVGLVPSAIYRHFRGKDEIIDAVIDVIGARLMENVERVRAETPGAIARLSRILSLHIQLLHANQALPRIVFSEDAYGGRPERRARVYGVIAKYLREIADILREGRHSGEIRTDIDPDMASVMFLGVIQPPAILWIMSGGRFDAAGQSERAWKVLREMLTKGAADRAKKTRERRRT